MDLTMVGELRDLLKKRGRIGMSGSARRRVDAVLSPIAVCISVVVATLVLPASPAMAVGGYHIDTGPGTTQAVVRSGPAMSYGQVGAINNGTPIDIACQATGGSAPTSTGGSSSIWDQLNSPYAGQWISDTTASTPNIGSYSPGIPQCTFIYSIYTGPGTTQAVVRSGPATTYVAVGALNNGTPISIACQIIGGPAPTSAGGVSNIWDQLNSPYAGQWISDTTANTPNVGSFSPGIPQCSAQPPDHYFNVLGTSNLGLIERTGPGTNYSSIGTLPEGTHIDIYCQTSSASVIGGSPIWDQLSNSYFVSDFYTNTPVYGNFSPGIPQCAGTPAPPPVQSGSYAVQGTAPFGLKKRTGPGIAFSAVGLLPDGSSVQIACQARSGDYENGSSIWDELGDGSWLADGYVSTPAVNQFTSGIPRCTSIPSAPPGAYPVRSTYGQTGRTVYGSNPTALRADPVNTDTGAWWTQATDASLPGTGVPFAFTRSYTSASTLTGPLGYGWTANFLTSLTINSDGSATVLGDQGQELQFANEGGGLFAPSAGTTAVLTTTPGGYQLLLDNLTSFNFNGSGQLVSELARNGKGITLTYTGSSLSQIVDSAGRTIQFVHGPTGLITSMILPGGTSVAYGYTGTLLTSATDQDGAVTTFAYDSSQRLTQETDGNGHVAVLNTYGADGRVIAQVDGQGNRRTFAWDPATQTSTMTDARGNAWKDVYQNNVLQEQIDPLGNTTSYRYDGDLNRTAVTDPDGNTTTFTYDQHGNRLSETDPSPLSYTQTWTYNAYDQITSHTDGLGNTTSYSYDSIGNQVLQTNPDGSTIQSSYTPGTDLVASTTDQLGNQTTFDYDASFNRIDQISPLGEKVSYGYDALGRKISEVAPRGNVSGANPAAFQTTFTYDGVGHLLTTTDPVGHASTTTYDALGNKLSATDASGNVTHWLYDADNRLIQTTNPNGTTEVNSYDPTGNKISTTDEKGAVTRYGCDAANRLISQTTPLNRTTTFSLDAAGNEVTKTEPSGAVATSTFDALNRISSTSYSDGRTHAVTYSYNADGNRTSMSDGTGTTTYAYDSLQRLTSTVTGAGKTVDYGYDLDGHITALTYPNGKTVTQAFDGDGRLTRVSDWLGHTSVLTYDADGNQIAETLGTMTDSDVFNSDDQVMSSSDQLGKKVLQGFSYARNSDALVTSTTNGNSTETYSYDSMNQLASDSKNTFNYDAAGNLIRSVKNTPLSYDSSDQLLAAGNAKQVTRFTFDSEGERTSVTPPKGAATLYGYDQAGHMTSLNQRTASTLYSYNGDGLRMAKQSGSSTTEFTWDTAAANALLLSDGSTNYIYGPQGLPIESVDSAGVVSFYHHDQLGSTTMLTSLTGKKEALFGYNSFGLLQKHSGTASTPLLFAGQYRDTESGLYYLQARYYDPSTGQFMEVDPLVDQTGTPYSYGANDPVNNSDPSGQSLWNPNTWSPLAQLIVGQVPGKSGGALGAYQGIAQIAQSWASTAGTCNTFSSSCVAAVFGSLRQTSWSGGLVFVGFAYSIAGRLITDVNYVITGQQLDRGQLCG